TASTTSRALHDALPICPRHAHTAASPHARRSPTQQPSPRKNPALATASAVHFSPATLSARNHSTSELLRTLSRMAASKPTSWLRSDEHTSELQSRENLV